MGKITADIDVNSTRSAAGGPTTVFRRRIRPRISGWWLCFLLLFAIGEVWALTIPPFAQSDEASQVSKAMGTGYGHFIPYFGADVPGGGGPSTVQRLGAFTVPARYAYNWTCFIGKPTQPATCAGVFGGTKKDSAGATYHEDYPPLYYGLVGWPAAVFSAPQSYYVMRTISAAVMAAFIASALASAIVGRRSRLLALGVLIATTPGVLFLGAGIDSSGFEVVTALCLWTTLLVLFAEPATSLAMNSAESAPQRARPEPQTGAESSVARQNRLITRAVVAAVALMLARPLSPIWVVLIVAFSLALSRRAVMAHLLRLRRVRVGLMAVALSGLAALAWYVLRQPGRDLIRYAKGLAHPGYRAVAEELIGGFGSRFHDMIGRFGWPGEVRAPTITMIGWIVSLTLVGFFAMAAGTRRERLILLGVVAVLLLVPLVIVVPQTQYVNGWAGRYDLPLAIGFPLVSAFILDQRPAQLESFRAVIAVVVATSLAIGYVVAYAAVARRYIVGIHGPLLYILHVDWAPRLPAWFLLVSMTTATAALVWLTWRALERRSPFEDGLELSRRGLVSLLGR